MEKPSLIKRFFSFLLKVIVVIVLMVIIAVGSFEGVTYYLTGSLYDLREFVEEETSIQELVDNNEDGTESTDIDIDETNMRNTLIFVDSDTSEDQYIVLNMLNTENYALDILLVPVTAQVTVSKDVLTDIQEEISDAGKTVTLGSVASAFGDGKYDMITEILEDVTSISISGYDVMSQESFADFLDMVDSVEYQLDNSISYRDEDGVLNVIDEETMELDNDQGIVLITYLDGTETEETDRLERTSTYLQTFLTNLFDENDASVIYRKYASLVASSSDRDLSEEEDIISELDMDNMTIRILQGSESGGIYSIDSEKVQLQIASLVQQAESSDSSRSSSSSSSTSGSVDSKEYSLELYNAAYVSGLAAEWQVYLEEEGYTIALIDSYQDEGPISTTRIVVSEEGMGEDLLEYFPDATIEVDDIDTGGDIQIYIGTDSTDVGGTDDSAAYDENDGDEEDTEYDIEEEDTEEEDIEEDDAEEGTTEEESGYSSNDSYSFDTDSE